MTIWQKIKCFHLVICKGTKEAFPFFFGKIISGVFHTPAMMENRELHFIIKSIAATYRCDLCKSPVQFTEKDMIELDSYGIDDNELSIMKIICGNCHKMTIKRQEKILRNQRLEPYFVALAILVGLLVLDGFLTHWGFVDYSPILK